MTRVKICGITTVEDALAVCESGADAIGFVFARSSRQITRDAAVEIVRELPPFVTTVGVFVDETVENVRETMRYCGLGLAQLHGHEDDRYCAALGLPFIKTFNLQGEEMLGTIGSFPYKDFLVDSHVAGRSGGTGRACDWALAARASELGRMVLAGGLTPENVKAALDAVRPYAVDVSSGVELSPGKKNISRVQQFINEVKSWDIQTNGVISANTAADLFPRR